MSDWHVYPTNDLTAHDIETDSCVCGPLFDPVRRSDGSYGWVVVHHSLDGREFKEF